MRHVNTLARWIISSLLAVSVPFVSPVWAKRPLVYDSTAKPATKVPVSVISSPEAIYDLLTAEFLEQAQQLKAASRLYFPYAVRSSSVALVEKAALTAFLSGDIEQSERLARHWLKLVPDDRRAHQILVAAHIMQKQYTLATHEMSSFIAKDKVSPHPQGGASLWIAPILQGVRSASQDDNEAFRHFDALLLAARDSSVHSFLSLDIGVLAFEAKNPIHTDRGMKVLDALMHEKPTILEPIIYYALLMAKEEPEKAGEWLKAAIVKQGQTESAYMTAGLILSSRQQLAFARPVFEQAVKSYPKNAAFQSIYLQTLLEGRAYEQAQKTLADLLTVLDPREARTTQMTIQFMRLAKTASEREAALVFLRRVPSTDEYYEAVQEIILYELSELDPARAVAHLENIEKKEQVNLSALWGLPIETLKKQQKFSVALEVANRGLTLHPESEDLLEAKAVLLSELNRMSEAEKIWRQLIEKHADQPSYYNNLGYILLEKTDRLDDAELLIRKAYALAPKDAAILDSMGWIAFKKANMKESLAYLQEALAIGSPSDADVLLHLLEVYAKTGQSDQVKATLNKIQVLKTKTWTPLVDVKKRLNIVD